MKKNLFLLFFAFFILLGLGLGSVTQADSSTPPPCGIPSGCGAATVTVKPSDLSPVGTPSVYQLIGIVIAGALGIIGSISLLIFVYAGFLMLISQGDPSKVQKSKAIMVWAAIGLIVIFGSYILVTYILTGLGGLNLTQSNTANPNAPATTPQ